MDRQPARTCPAGTVAVLAFIVLATLAGSTGTVLGSGPAAAATRPAHGKRSATRTVGPTPPLVLLSQTPWVTPEGVFDLHLQVAPSAKPAANQGIIVSVYPCLSTVSGFDETLSSVPDSTPLVTSSALPITGLTPLSGGGVDLSMPVQVGGVGSTSTGAGAPFAIQLHSEDGQCQSFPGGVFPVRVQLVNTSTTTVEGGFTTYLVVSDAPADTEKLRVAIVLPIQATQRASNSPPETELRVHPGAALDNPPAATLNALAATVDGIATNHPPVPLTLQVSGQTVDLLATTPHDPTLAQLARLADTPTTYQLTAAPFTPVDATALVGSGLTDELASQVSRGVEVVEAATGEPDPTPSTGLGAWVTSDGMDADTVAALANQGFRQLVLPSSDVSGAPAEGSTTQPFTLPGAGSSQITAMAADADLTARFTSDPDDPVLAAHNLVAELAQIYYERPNGIAPRVVAAVAPVTWTDNPAFVDALLDSLDGNPVVQAVTTSGLFSEFPTPTTCRSGCRLTGVGGGAVPAAAIRSARMRVDGFAGAAINTKTLDDQLGDLVLGGEAQDLGPVQQAAVVRNAGAALNAQLGLLSVEGDQTITLTASSGTIPVTVVSNADYPVEASLTLSSDKLLFQNGETQWTTPRTLLPRSNVFYVRVRTRTSGDFRLDVSLSSPDGNLRMAEGELSIRSTSSSVVGLVLTVGAVAVLAAWWFRTSRKRRADRRTEYREDTAAP